MYWQITIGFLLLLVVFPGVRARVRYFFVYFLYGTVVMVGSAVYSIKFLLKGKPCYENSCEFLKVFRLARTLMGLQPRLFGLETYDPDQQYVYVLNHQSFIDVLSLVDVWKFPSVVVAKNSLKYFGLLGIILYYTKSIFLHRHNHAKAVSEINCAIERIVNDKINIFMFPEGTRNSSGHLLPFKKGAFHLAIQTQVPIQPIVLSCYNSFLDHKKFSFTSVPYGVYMLPPIPTVGMDNSQVDELMKRTYEAMSEVFERTVHASPEELGEDLRKKSN